MAHREESVSAGTKSIAPVTIQTLPVFIAGIPTPTIQDSIYSQTADGKRIAIGVGVVIGLNGGIGIGNGANAGGTANGSIAIGRTADANGGGNAGGSNIAIGFGANYGGGVGGLGVAIGNLALINSPAGGHVAIGASASVTAGLGKDGAIAIGASTSAAHRAIAIGIGAVTTKDGEVVFGDIANGPITLVSFRPGAGVPVRHRNSAAGWAIRSVADGADIFMVDESATAGDSRMLVWDVSGTTNGLKRVTFGADNSAGAGFKWLRVAN